MKKEIFVRVLTIVVIMLIILLLEKCIEQLCLIGWDFHLNFVICPPPPMIMLAMMIISPFICI